MIIGKAISPFALRKKGNGTDADAQLFITATGISGTNATATNQLVIDLKSANIWTKMKAIYPFVGNTANSQKYNLKDARDLNAAYRLAFSGGGTFSANGYQPGGVNGYANTFLSPNNVFTDYNSHMSYYSRTNNITTAIDIGSVGDGNNFFMQLYSSGLPGSRSSIQRNDTDYAVFSSTSRQGLFIGNSTASNSQKIYQNNLLKNTNTVTNITGKSTYALYIGALNSTNVAAAYSNRECAFASIGNGLTDAEALALYNAVQLFNTTLGRQV